MFRSDNQSDAKPLVLSSQTNLGLIYRPTEGVKGRVATFPILGFEPRTCSEEARNATQPLGGFKATFRPRLSASSQSETSSRPR
ncbi:hypothetical protein TNCV_772831 [Trichonephila clavipes]|nr:hypothetical protein TNCV_772831 [Trichonephila clavipes]